VTGGSVTGGTSIGDTYRLLLAGQQSDERTKKALVTSLA